MPSTVGITNSGSRGSRIELLAASGTTLSGWTWYGGGFGATKYAAPATTPGGAATSYFAPTPNGKAVAMSWTKSSGTQYLAYAYEWSSASGWGTKYSDANSVTSVNISRRGVFSNDGANLIVGVGSGSPRNQTIPWDDSTGFGTATSATGLLEGPIFGIDINKSNNRVAFAFGTNGVSDIYIAAFPWTSSGTGTRYSSPATLPPDQQNDVKFSPDETVVASCGGSNPQVNAYVWSNSTGFGTKYSDPATLPTNTATSVFWGGNGSILAVSHATSPYVTVYAWSNGFGTKYANPATLPSGTGSDVFMTPNSSDIFVNTAGNSPWVHAYVWSSGFGTKYSDPSDNLTGTSLFVPTPVH